MSQFPASVATMKLKPIDDIWEIIFGHNKILVHKPKALNTIFLISLLSDSQALLVA